MHAVLNWLWQGCVVALVLFAMLGLLGRARANVRYLLCWAAQLLVMALPLVTMLVLGAGESLSLPRVAVAPVVSVPDAWWSSGALMAAAWFAWAAVGVVRSVRAIAMLRRMRTLSSPFPPHVEAGLMHWGRVRHRGRRPRLVLSDAVTAAAVLGAGAPVIAVAPALVTRLDAADLDRVLIHEWAHVQRRDDLVGLLQIAVRIVAGWHPAVWWIDRRLQAEREIACDETTVAIAGAPKSYAACLVKLADLRLAAHPSLAAPAVLAARGLRARVLRIVSPGAFLAPTWSFSAAAAIAATLAVVSIAVAQTRLVEPAVFAFSDESLRMARVHLEGLVPVAGQVALSRQAPAPAPPVRPAADRARRPITDVDVVPVSRDTQRAEPEAVPAPPAAADTGAPQAASEAPADRVTAPEPVALTASPVPATITRDRERSPWAQAADGGTALGKVSKEAGVATAGFFSRFGRRVAGSF